MRHHKPAMAKTTQCPAALTVLAVVLNTTKPRNSRNEFRGFNILGNRVRQNHQRLTHCYCLFLLPFLFPDIRVIEPDAALIEDGIQAGLLLFFVVIEGCKGNAAEEDDRDDVDDCFEAHRNIRKTPCDIQAVAGTDKDHDGCGNAEECHDSLVLRDKEDICLRIEVVADDRCEGEQTDDNSDKVDADGADDSGNALLQKRDARIAAERPVSREQNQEDGRGTDQQGVDVDRDDLGKSLLGGMRDRRGSTGIGGGAHAGLIGEEASLNAQHHTGSGKASEDGLEVKGICQDDSQHSGNPGDVGDDDENADQNIEAGHNRHQDRRNSADQVTCEEDDQSTDCEDNTDHSGNDAGCKILHIDIKGRDNIIGLQAVESEGKGGDQGNGKDDAQPARMKGTLNIVGGPSLEGIAFFLFIDLGKCTLDEGGCRAQNRHEPHPESCAGAAENDGGSNARHVARTYAGSGGDHQRLEGGNSLVAFFLFHHAVHSVLESPDLYEPRADRKIDAAPCQQIDQQPGI